jgi:hypothetical protein
MINQKNKIHFTTKYDEKTGPKLVIEFGNRKVGLCFCHRLPDRSLSIKGYTLPLCARCTGIVIGSLFSITMFYFNVMFSIIINT